MKKNKNRRNKKNSNKTSTEKRLIERPPFLQRNVRKTKAIRTSIIRKKNILVDTEGSLEEVSHTAS